MAESPANLSVEPRRRSWLWLGLVVTGYAVFDVVCDPFSFSPTPADRWKGEIMLGVVFTLPLFLGTWAALGPGPYHYRIPLTVAALGVASIPLSPFRGAILKRANYINYQNIQYVELMWYLGIGFLIVFVAMFVIAKLARRRICRSSDAIGPYVPVRQYSLRSLLGLVTFLAVVLGFGKLLVNQFSPANGPSGTISRQAMEAALIIWVALPFLFVPLAALLQRPRAWMLAAILVFWAISACSAIGIIVSVFGQPLESTIWQIASMHLGALCAASLVAIAMRLSDYRLSESTSASVPAAPFEA